MDTKDYYTILGVNEGGSLDEIKSAYRSLALKYHPDRCSEEKKKEGEEKFKEISAAYYVLGDAQRKKEYDDYRKGAYEFRSGHDSGDFASQTGFDFDDLMKHFVGMKGGRAHDTHNRYFSFDDLQDLFQGVRGVSGGHSEIYTDYDSVDTGPVHKHSTDVYAELNIPQNVALRGGGAKFRLQDGRMITLKISPNTKNGQKLRLKGLGKTCPCCDHKGDLTVTMRFA